MNYWIMTDFHLGHTEKMIKWCGRPKDYEIKIFDGLRMISDGDVFIFLGDYCIGNDGYWHESHIMKFDFKKILVLGNHDKKSYSWYYRYGWDLVCETFSMNIFGKKILFSHKPQIDSGYDLNIHGHIHDATKLRYEADVEEVKNDKQILIKPEQYNPISLRKICNQ
ncbi:MAG: hypothetical protein GY861_14570 [bacterium]|nr:hypothetical protein [bacterium]